VSGEAYKQQTLVIFGKKGIYVSKEQLNKKEFPPSSNGLSSEFHFEVANLPKIHSFF
jgi:hypothetical protein